MGPFWCDIYCARNPKAVADLVKKVVPLQLDVTKPKDVANAVAKATDVAVLTNNAGIATNFGGAFSDDRLIEAGRQEMEVNVFGPFALTQGFASVLAKNGGGGVVNVLSVVSLVTFPSAITYSASKGPPPTRSHRPRGRSCGRMAPM